jgi:hypothetical protein
MEQHSYVMQKACDILHDAVEKRFDRVEKTIDKQWDTIDLIRRLNHRQTITVATVVGGISALVQIIAIVLQSQLRH